VIVRKAEARDVPAIISGSIEFAGWAYPKDEVDRTYLANVIELAIERPDAVVAVLETPAKEFAGAFFAALGPHPLNGSPICAEMIVWTSPKGRGHGGKLVEYVERWAGRNGCPLMILSPPAEAPERTAKVFKAWGYRPSEVWYRKAMQ